MLRRAYFEKYKGNQWGSNNQYLYAATVYWYQDQGTSEAYMPVSLDERLATQINGRNN
ncbi:hypothetical protein [Paenibacillus sp. IHBB 3054]|uniref:hypothetical protein n=1 Tax=Paenibacillus sp. IHBB 3054 TaxID=3425689 RepID=UPI003F66A701